LTLFGVAAFLGLLTIVTGQFAPSRYHLTAGEVSPVTVKSPQKVVYSSQIRTREERARAAAEVAELYVFDLASVEAQRQKLNDIIRQIGEARRTAGSLETRREPLTRLPNVRLRPSVIDDLLTFSDGDWQAVASDAQRVIDVLMRNRITERQLEEIRTTLPAYVGIGLNDRQGPAVVALVGPLLKANFVLDPDGTERVRREAQERIEPVRVTIEKGETIVRDGDVVRPFDIERLEAVGLRNPTIEWRSIVASALLIWLLVSALVLYIHYFRPRLADQPRSLLLVELILLLTVLAVKLIVPGRDLWAYVLPLAAPAMLIALLLGADLAIVLNIVLAVCFGLIGSSAFELSFIALIGGLAGTIMVWRFERLNTFFLAGLVIAIANFAASSAFALMAGEVEPQRLAILGGLAAFNGMLSAALTLGTLAIFGHLFGITTTLGLLELAHPTQPLFRRLLTEAPGTYHHSVVIANLAERAAEAVGADPLLCRVGAYYHDIGKIVRPYAFIENQLAEENIHDRLDPATSARMIGAHVTDGLELARKYRLPDRVRDVIAQHHGTRLIGAFYQRALAQSDGAAIDQAGFKYGGPRPQTREAGILMLADGVEATLRAVHDHTADGIERTIRKVVDERLAEGQLDECDLTFRDLDRIRQAFFNILRGMFHPRITYPDYPGAPPAADAPVAPQPLALERG
jgi:putative nucleotidyltransferase with HDIG domain